MEAKIELEEGWLALLKDLFEGQTMQQLSAFLRCEKQAGKQIFPQGRQMFRALNACPLSHVKVVILGQDPYHGPGQANGLAFSVNPGVPLPPSLQNIYKELDADIQGRTAASEQRFGGRDGNLGHWAEEGVLLLNSVLSVEAGLAASHQGRGWEFFTTSLIERLAARQQGLVFILWGAYARKKAQNIDSQQHCIIESAHPSPLSAHRGFFGSRPFSRCNAYLIQQGKSPIAW